MENMLELMDKEMKSMVSNMDNATLLSALTFAEGQRDHILKEMELRNLKRIVVE